MECTHLEFHFIVFDNGYSHFEEVVFSFQKEIIPNSIQKLFILIEAIGKNRNKPTDQIHFGFEFKNFEVTFDFRYILFQKKLK